MDPRIAKHMGKATSSRARPWRVARASFLLAAAAMCAVFAGQALAGCGQYEGGSSPAPFDRPSAAPSLMHALFRPGDAELHHVSEQAEDGIVGMWRFTVTSDGSAYPVPIKYGDVVDFGTMQYHSDNTEFTISGGRAPSSGDVCMGVWKQTGRHTFKLHHIALAWSSADSRPPGPVAYIGPAFINAELTLNRAGDRFEGWYTIDQYATDEVTLIEHIGTKITAQRVTVN